MTGKVHYGSRRGWYIQWPNGFESAMPDEATARRCAGSADLLTACEECASWMREYGVQNNDEGAEGLAEQVSAAIAKATTL